MEMVKTSLREFFLEDYIKSSGYKANCQIIHEVSCIIDCLGRDRRERSLSISMPSPSQIAYDMTHEADFGVLSNENAVASFGISIHGRIVKVIGSQAVKVSTSRDDGVICDPTIDIRFNGDIEFLRLPFLLLPPLLMIAFILPLVVV